MRRIVRSFAALAVFAGLAIAPITPASACNDGVGLAGNIAVNATLGWTELPRGVVDTVKAYHPLAFPLTIPAGVIVGAFQTTVRYLALVPDAVDAEINCSTVVPPVLVGPPVSLALPGL